MKKLGLAFGACAVMLGCGASEGGGALSADASVDAVDGATATSVQALTTCPRPRVRPATCREWVCERINGCIVCACRD